MHRVAALWVTALLAAGAAPAGAQQPNPLESPPALKPAPETSTAPRPAAPGRSAADEKSVTPQGDDAEPVVTIRQDGENRIEEFRVHGRLYAIRVTPRIGKPYVMVDPDGKGHMDRVETGADDPAGRSVHPPRWVLLEF